MNHILANAETRSEWGERRWAQFLNSVTGFKSANLIGTSSSAAGENLAIVSSVFHMGSHPALIGFMVRPHSEESPRHTLLNIKESKRYTINGVSSKFYQKAHQTSARYAIDDSEFQKVELESEYREGCAAPFVKASPLQLQMRLEEIKDIELNGTHLVIGRVEQVYVDEKYITEEGYLDLEAMELVSISGLGSYHSTQRLSRLEYAKPDSPVRVKAEKKSLGSGA